MAEVVQGSKIIYLYRLLSEQATSDAFRLAFVTEDSISYSKDADTTVTKDGVIRTPSPAEIEKPVTCILAKGDTDIKKLKDAMLDDEIIELWEATLMNLHQAKKAMTNSQVHTIKAILRLSRKRPTLKTW